MKRWLSLLEVAEVLAKQKPKIGKLSPKRQREHVLRLVRKVERVEDAKLKKRVGREWYVSLEGADALQKWDPDSLHALGRSVADLHSKFTQQRRQSNAHGAKLREHDRRLGILEEKERLTTTYLEAMQAIDRRNSAA